MLCEAREKTIQEMIKEAEDLGANAVIGVTISSMYASMLHRCMLIATGTAVWL